MKKNLFLNTLDASFKWMKIVPCEKKLDWRKGSDRIKLVNSSGRRREQSSGFMALNQIGNSPHSPFNRWRMGVTWRGSSPHILSRHVGQTVLGRVVRYFSFGFCFIRNTPLKTISCPRDFNKRKGKRIEDIFK